MAIFTNLPACSDEICPDSKSDNAFYGAAVTCVIPGTSNPRHTPDNMGAGYGPVPDEVGRKKMAAFFDSL